MRRLVTAVAWLVLAAGLAGCVDAKVEAPSLGQAPTVGQQLMQLKAAHDRGDLTDRQYQQERQRIVDRAYAPEKE
jgi:hypothetical protein